MILFSRPLLLPAAVKLSFVAVSDFSDTLDTIDRFSFLTLNFFFLKTIIYIKVLVCLVKDSN